MIPRLAHLDRVLSLLARYPVVAILGPRQVGKTTLARQVAEASFEPVSVFDLEDPRDLAVLEEPTLALEGLRGLVVLDEIQERPNLFPILRVLADRPGTPARFLILGSAAPDLLRQGSETLAGRIAFHELGGFDLEEVGVENLERLWLRGGFPRSYLADTDLESEEWRQNFIRTFVERDLPRLGGLAASADMGRFWAMLAHLHGSVLNASELGRSFGVSHTTVRKYLQMLVGTYVVDELRPWHENSGKRLVKSPKVYVADSGLLHALLGLVGMRDLLRHPKVGASWEGFILRQIIRCLRARREECFFWATHAGAELDLLVVSGPTRLGFEIKRTDRPAMTPSMRSAMEAPRLDRLDIVHAGKRTFDLGPAIRAIAAADLLRNLSAVR